jgi:hypothetical protein
VACPPGRSCATSAQPAAAREIFPLAPRAARCGHRRPTNTMISPETFSHIENIKKRAGHLWRFL